MNKDYVYKRRLLMLADFLDKLPRERFDYGHWASDNWQGKANLSCGTTACALGWATAIPALRRAGLILYFNSGLPYVSLKNRLFRAGPEDASEEIFGLTYREHHILFIPKSFKEDLYTGPTADATPKEVAKHIRKFVKNKYPDKK